MPEPRPLPIRPSLDSSWFALVQQARQGNFGYYQHACGYIEAFALSQLDEMERDGTGGGCDACESGSPNPGDWQPVWIMVREELPAPNYRERPPCE